MTSTPTTVSSEATDQETALPPFDRRVIVVGGILFAVLMVFANRYGFYRDELYFLDCARHLQASYVDQPVLTPLVAWVSLKLFGMSLIGLRLWPALASWATVVVGGLTAREFGGGRRVQLLTAVATATMPGVIANGHILVTEPFDVLAWASLALIVIRIGRTGDCRWWIAGGLVCGIGLANKHLIAGFAVAIFIGALLSGGRRLVLNRWFLAGTLIAALFTVPDIWWQAQHGWATISMTHALSQLNGGPRYIPAWILGQLSKTTLAMIWVWIAGLRSLWRSDRPLWRALVWAYGLLFVVFGITAGDQTYYLQAAYIYLLAAGFLAVDGWLAARKHRLRVLALGTVLTTAITLPVVLPIVQPAHLGKLSKLNVTLGDSIGWPQDVSTIRTVWMSLPPAQRANAVLVGSNYGETAAINELGRGTGLPTAEGTQNSDWWWGPGNPHATTVVIVTPGPLSPDLPSAQGRTAGLSKFFTHVRAVATLPDPFGVHNFEAGGVIYLCTGPREPWGEVWQHIRIYI